ncbi:hypothetical protein GE061_013809 [Apolygus lucorum]|uniref:Uncharacterized protein n=1 Tax=Apolygus lucorum TaxID=248454 RepID=A0A8S9XNS0_APOLU|nr:hypothetical protein GE061_013809 [Apolygus lucorum]
MFKSRIDENLKADEILQDENEGLCYEIVKIGEEKLLTLEEARRLVEQNFVLNREELTGNIEDIFGSNYCDPFLSQYINTNAGDADEIIPYDNQSDRDYNTEDEAPTYIGRGYGLLGAQMMPVEEIDDDLLLDDSDEITSTIDFNQKKIGNEVPLTNYGKGPPPFWSNVFAESSSDED